jgi:hypothetical protein
MELDVRLGIDNVGDLGKRRIAGPDFGCGLQFGFKCFLVSAHRGVTGLGDIHRRDLLCRLDGSHRFGNIEILLPFRSTRLIYSVSAGGAGAGVTFRRAPY